MKIVESNFRWGLASPMSSDRLVARCFLEAGSRLDHSKKRRGRTSAWQRAPVLQASHEHRSIYWLGALTRRLFRHVAKTGFASRILSAVLRILGAALLVLAAVEAQAGVIFTTLYSFGAVQDTNGNLLDGANPAAALVPGDDGCFYGTTENGGTNGVGTVFKISAQGVMTSLWSFSDVTDGAIPVSALLRGNDGWFYGTTWSGGTNGFGTIFRISTSGEFTCLYSFTGTNDGGRPSAALVQGQDGYLYGTTFLGGAGSALSGEINDPGPGYGTVFRTSTSGVLSNLYSFTGTNDGASPRAALVQDSDGYFYGTTSAGGLTNNLGTVFKISTNGALTTLYAFGSVRDTNGDSLDGAAPQAALVPRSDGYFYGTTSGLGDLIAGTVFKMSTNGVLTTLYSFTGIDNGAAPNGLVQGSDGNFYGTSQLDWWYVWGGPIYPLNHPNDGDLFKISPNGVLTSLYAFDTDNGTNGANPTAALVQGSDGSLYGTTSHGGTHGWGTVFKVTLVPEPQLTIIPFGPSVVLTWPTNAFVFTLQSTTNLDSVANWYTNTLPPIVIGGLNVVVFPIADSQVFYRLWLAP